MGRKDQRHKQGDAGGFLQALEPGLLAPLPSWLVPLSEGPLWALLVWEPGNMREGGHPAEWSAP